MIITYTEKEVAVMFCVPLCEVVQWFDDNQFRWYYDPQRIRKATHNSLMGFKKRMHDKKIFDLFAKEKQNRE